jgi:hypothetical protein
MGIQTRVGKLQTLLDQVHGLPKQLFRFQLCGLHQSSSAISGWRRLSTLQRKRAFNVFLEKRAFALDTQGGFATISVRGGAAR